MRRHWGLAVVVAAIFLSMGLYAGVGGAQTFRGAILGTVTDTSGGSVAGAQVSIRNVDTGIVRTTVTDADGSYNIPEVPVGTYSVNISKENFDTSVTNTVKVDVAAEVRVDAVLKPGAVSQSVTVSGESLAQVDTTTNVLGATLTQSTIKEVPVNGRDYTKLIYLTPGVTGSPDQITDSPGSYGVFSMNGARGRSNNFLLDGTDMNDGYRNDPAINEAGVFGTPATILPIDAVSELRVLSNFEPEYGRNAGAVINIVTKSGTNALHGDFFDYLRNNALDARNFFNTVNEPQAGFRNNQFGGSMGGPIIKDKTFFFLDYEGQREAVGVVTQGCVPDPKEIAALGGATNPVIAALLARNPWPTTITPGYSSTDSGCINTATGAPSPFDTTAISPSFNNVDSVIAKIDHNFDQNNTLTGRYYFGNSTQSFPLQLTASGGQLPGFNTNTPTRVQLVSLSYLHIFSPTQVNEVRYGWNRFAEGFFPQDQSFQPSSIGLCASSTVAECTGASAENGGLPIISVSGFSQLGANGSDPRHRVDANNQFIDDYSWKIGKHDLKFGFEFRRTSISQYFDKDFRGSLDFNDLEDFLDGTVDGGFQYGGDTDRNTFQNDYGLYFQDSFHLISRLTFNYGLRWDYFGVVGEKQNQFSDFDTTTGALIPVGPGGYSGIYNPDYNNFGPRVSVAWDVFGTGKTVVRSGFGIFYDAFSQDMFLGHLPYPPYFDPGPAYNPIGPNQIVPAAANGSIVSGQPVYGTPSCASVECDVFSFDHNTRTPYYENYNLNIEQRLSTKVMVQLSYVGSEGHKLFRFVDLNQPTQATITDCDEGLLPQYASFGVCATPGITASYSVPRPYGTAFGPATANVPYAGMVNPYGATYIMQEQSSANSNYNSLQASLRMTGWHGFTSIVNYVYSRSFDNASDGDDFEPNAAQPNNSYNTNLEYGPSNFDVPQRFTWIFGYELPNMGGGWQKLKNGWGIDSTVTLQSGQPFQFNYNFEDDFSGSGEGFDRPDVVGPVTYDQNNPANYVQLSSFAIPCNVDVTTANGAASDCVPGTRHFGDEGRDSLRGPTFKQWDMALYKNTALTERLSMQLRVEFYNFLNHPNFANPFLPAFIADPGVNGFQVNGNREVGVGAYAIGATGDVGIGNPFLGGGGPRGIQLAAKFSF